MISTENIARSLNISYDKINDYAFGNISNYNIMINFNKTSGLYQVNTNVVGAEFGEYAINSIKATSPAITNISINNTHIVASVMGGADDNQTISNIGGATAALTGYFASNNMSNSCGICHNHNTALTPYKVSDFGFAVCPNCENSSLAAAAALGKPGNLGKGLIGAFFGSLIGVAAIVIINMLGYVAAISGIIMAVASLKGYQMLGGNLSKKGVILSFLIMIAMTFVADQLTWAIEVSKVFGTGIIDSFFAVPSIINQSGIFNDYITNLLQLLLFTGLGCVLQVVSVFKSVSKNKANISKLEYRM